MDSTMEKLSIEWWRKLPLDKKEFIKQECHNIVGIKWEDILVLFTPRERIEIIYVKLLLEGVIE